GKEELFSPSFPPDTSSGPKTARQSPYYRLLAAEGLVLFHEPAPNAIADVVVDVRKYIACSCAKAEVIPPTSQDGIQLLEEARQRPADRRSCGQLLRLVPNIRPLVGRDFNPRHVAEPGMPFIANPVPEELESLSRIGDAGLFERQFQPHCFKQVSGERRFFVFGLLAGACDENDEVVGISDREEHRPSGFALGHAGPHRCRHWVTATMRPDLLSVMRPPLVSFLDDAEGDIGEQ